MIDRIGRTGADDDVLVERLRALAWGGEGAVASGSCMPDEPFPPLTSVDVEAAEGRLGYRLPRLLRRVHTEIGDGGFGPEGGLASLKPRSIPQWYYPHWPCATTLHARRPEWRRPPASWFFPAGGGCGMEWYVSLIAVDHPVLLWDSDGWEPDRGEDPHDGLRYAARSLREWLWTWADGGNVWDPVSARPDETP
ncbi:SMI1/KNR4 family protein [Embleya sp. NPDC050154]|uniref:SMI1/KNR4 family protein n=1 Tax=Embleya sp. NPDC050154 TaxID=3363988 RepID=UPI0037AFB3E1